MYLCIHRYETFRNGQTKSNIQTFRHFHLDCNAHYERIHTQAFRHTNIHTHKYTHTHIDIITPFIHIPHAAINRLCIGNINKTSQATIVSLQSILKRNSENLQIKCINEVCTYTISNFRNSFLSENRHKFHGYLCVNINTSDRIDSRFI